MTDREAIVIDPGSLRLKAGFAGDDAPRVVIPSLVGRPRTKLGSVCTADGSTFVGDDAEARRAELSVKYPIDCGIVCNWDDFELLLEHTFTSQLRVDPKEFNVYMAEPPVVPKVSREKMIQIMFEKFGVPGVYLQSTSVLILVSAGRTTGVTVESGHSTTYTSAVYEGHTLPHTVPKTFYAGQDLDWYLQSLINTKGYQLNSSAETQIVRKMKESTCFISMDYEKDLELSKTSDKFHREYKLPDGHKICLNSERFVVGEGLFNPSLMQNDFPGIHCQVKRTITLADDDLQPLLCRNIHLAGGTTMFESFKERLSSELNKLLPRLPNQCVKLVGVPERKMLAWLGGSVLASLSFMDKQWITSSDYEERGPGLVHKWCF